MKKIKILLFLTLVLISQSCFSEKRNIEDTFPFFNKTVDKHTIQNFKKNYTYQLKNIDYDRLVFSALEQKHMKQWVNSGNHKNFIVINLPAYKLYYIKTNQQEQYIDWETKVVIGTDYHQTPLIPMSISSLKYNPTWTPTFNMLKHNLYVNGKINWQWIERMKLEPYDLKGNKISWTKVKNLEIGQFKLIQKKGENNALGLIKFETNSKRNIYLHDTNHKEMFDKNERAFSSGCIRVQDPSTLASLIKNKNKKYIERNIDTGKTFWDKTQNTPVYILYDPINYKLNNESKYEKYSDPYHKLKNYVVPSNLFENKANIIEKKPNIEVLFD